MYTCSVPSQEIMDVLDESVLEKRKKKLEVKYMQCLKEFYLKNDLMNNNCDIYVKEYEKIGKNSIDKKMKELPKRVA
jgi:hypothetical protein